MILDTLRQSSRYESLHPSFATAFAFLREVEGTERLGRHDLDGDRCFALVQTYQTKPISEAVFEAHRKYIDIQFIATGRENILWAPVASMEDETSPYDESRDVILWKATTNCTPVHLDAGQFTVFFPDDAHAPTLQWDAPAQVFKVVIKVAVA